MPQNHLTEHLVDAFLHLAAEGLYPTFISNITLMRRSFHTTCCRAARTLNCFSDTGLKRGYIGKEIFQFQQGQCLFISIAIPFDCDTVVENNEPMLAIVIKFEPQMIADLITKMDKQQQVVTEDAHSEDLKLLWA